MSKKIIPFGSRDRLPVKRRVTKKEKIPAWAINGAVKVIKANMLKKDGNFERNVDEWVCCGVIPESNEEKIKHRDPIRHRAVMYVIKHKDRYLMRDLKKELNNNSISNGNEPRHPSQPPEIREERTKEIQNT